MVAFCKDSLRAKSQINSICSRPENLETQTIRNLVL